MIVFRREWVSYARAIVASAGLLFATTASATEVKEVRFGFGYGLVYLPIMVADAQGYFVAQAKKAGIADLTVSIHRFSGPPALNEAMLSNNLDAAAIGITGFLILWDKTRGRQDMRGLASLAAHEFVIFTNRPNVTSLADFSGEDKIAMPAPTSPQGILLRMAAEKLYGPGQYARLDNLMISMPHPDAVAALLAGTAGVTGYVATPPYISPLRKSEKVHAVTSSRDILGSRADATGVVLAASRAFVENNPNVSKAVVAALEDAMAFIAQSPDKAAEIYLKFEPSAKITRDDALGMLKDGSLTYAVPPTGLLNFARFLAKTGQLKAEPRSWHDVFFSLVHDREGS